MGNNMANKYCILDKANLENQYGEGTEIRSPFGLGIPLFEAEDKTLEEIYYYRWHVFMRHIKETPAGYIISEFLPDVPWAGIYNSISCAGGHHIYEGRWLHEQKFLRDYAAFWFTEGAEPRRYSFWIADAVYAACKVWGDFSLAEKLYENLKGNTAAWESTHQRDCGLFYQTDNRDGMEYSVGGPGLRPTINSYLFAEYRALSKIATRLGKTEEEKFYREKMENLKKLVDEKLWDPEAEFYKTLAERRDYTLADVREEVGYVPWYFHLPDDDEKAVAWKFLMDEKYFAAPYGPTTAEQNHPDFMKEFDHECLWNGPSWPYATTQTLVAMANLLTDYHQDYVSKSDYYALLHQYASCHYLTENGKTRPFVDENLDPFTGEWLARKILKSIRPLRNDVDRGQHYNHSGFCDLVLGGLMGIRPRDEEKVEIDPVFDEKNLAYACADGVKYHDHFITVLWDREGTRYGKGKGLFVFADGKCVKHTENLEKIEINF